MTEEESAAFIHVAKEFFDAAVAWADEREKGDDNDKATQEAWDRLFEIHHARVRKVQSLQALRDAMRENWDRERPSAAAELVACEKVYETHTNQLRATIAKQTEDIERLRGDNEWLRAQADRNEALRAEQAKALRKAAAKDSEAAGTLRANVAEIQLAEAMRELEWFRERDGKVRSQAAGRAFGAQLLVGWMEEYERANPKPGS